MNKKSTIIKINELPLRHIHLSLGDVKSVFGGCIGNHERGCTTECGCCPGLVCMNVSNNVENIRYKECFDSGSVNNSWG